MNRKTALLCLGLSVLIGSVNILPNRVNAQAEPCLLEARYQQDSIAQSFNISRGRLDAVEAAVAELELNPSKTKQDLNFLIVEVNDLINVLKETKRRLQTVEKALNKCETFSVLDLNTLLRLNQEFVIEYNYQQERLDAVVKRLKKIKIVE